LLELVSSVREFSEMSLTAIVRRNHITLYKVRCSCVEAWTGRWPRGAAAMR